MKIYTLEINDNKTAYPKKLLEYVSEARRERISRYRFREDQLLSLYGALMVRMAIIEATGIENSMLVFHTEKNGKPYLENNKELHFNLSHTKGYILCGVSFQGRLGVDVENYASSPPYDIAKKCFHNNEISHLNELSNEERGEFFYQVWTRKEAYIKYCGLGLSMELERIDTLDQGEKKRYLTWRDKEYICSLYCETEVAPELISLSEGDIHHYFLHE